METELQRGSGSGFRIDWSGCTDEESAPDTLSEDCNTERKDAYAAGAESLNTKAVKSAQEIYRDIFARE